MSEIAAGICLPPKVNLRSVFTLARFEVWTSVCKYLCVCLCPNDVRPVVCNVKTTALCTPHFDKILPVKCVQLANIW